MAKRPSKTTKGRAPRKAVPAKKTETKQAIVLRLPCFVGDADRLLARVPGIDLKAHATLWLLTHGETRKTERVRLFTECFCPVG